MQTRKTRPVPTAPGVSEGLRALAKTAAGAGVPRLTLELAGLRASQINGCAICNTRNRLNVISGHKTGEWVAQWIA